MKFRLKYAHSVEIEAGRVNDPFRGMEYSIDGNRVSQREFEQTWEPVEE
jgi:hypothetical protein